MPTKLRGLRFGELSLVDDPANEGARATLWKRAPDAAEPAIAPADQLRAKITKSGPDERAELGAILSDLLMLVSAADEVGNATPGQGETMTKEAQDLEAQVATEKARADKAEALVEKLRKAAEEASVGVEISDDGAVSVTPPAAAEPEETIMIEGEAVAKSAVPAPLLKSLEAQAARIAKMEAQAETEALCKRADAELPNLVGDVEVRAALIKAVDAIADEELRKSAYQTLKGADGVYADMSKGMGRYGDSGSRRDAKNASAIFNKRVDEIMARDKMRDRTAARRKAREEFPAEFQAMQEG